MKNELKLRETENITDFQEKNINLFSQVWNKSTFSIGIREPLEIEELQVIYEFVSIEYKSLSLTDIEKAFRLYSAQKLDFKDSHFQSFDNFFIGKVLNSYKEWLRRDNLNPKEYVSPKKQIENKQDIKTEQKRAFDFLEKYYEENNDFHFIANWKSAFIYAEENRIISLSITEKEDIKREVEAQIKAEYIEKKQLRGFIQSFDLYLEKSSLKNECRKKALINYFNK